MSQHNKRQGKRQAGGTSRLSLWWTQHREWVAGLSRGQRLRYRALQTAAILSAVIILVYLVLVMWIRVPDVPVPTPGTDSSQGNISQGGVTYEGAELPEVAKSGRKDGYYTFLVAGRDVASGATDTMLLFTFDSKGKTLNALSLPRDTMINTAAGSKRLNTVFARNRGATTLAPQERVANGMAALKQEVSKLTGIYADFYVMIEWDAIGELVDALGGVEFEVPYLMDYTDPFQDLRIYQEPGLRVLNGDDAMQVIRWRKNNGPGSDLQVGDTGRMEIQQNFLKAVLKECMDPATLLKIPALAQVFLDNVSTDLTIGNLLAFAQLAIGIDLQNGIRFDTVPYTGVSYKGASMVLPVQNDLLTLLNGGLNPYLDEIKASDLQLLYKKSDGSYGVTNGTLADAAMGVPPVVESEPEDPEEPVEPEIPLDPENPMDPEMPVEPEAPVDPETPVDPELPTEEAGDLPIEEPGGLEDLPQVLDPEAVLPDPNEPAEEVPASSEVEQPAA